MNPTLPPSKLQALERLLVGQTRSILTIQIALDALAPTLADNTELQEKLQASSEAIDKMMEAFAGYFDDSN